MTFLDDLSDFFPDVIVAQHGTLDGKGRLTPDAAPITLPARYEGEQKVVMVAPGVEQMSTVQAIVKGWTGFDPSNWQFTIPSRFSPCQDLEAMAVDREDDENGPLYEIVMFP